MYKQAFRQLTAMTFGLFVLCSAFSIAPVTGMAMTGSSPDGVVPHDEAAPEIKAENPVNLEKALGKRAIGNPDAPVTMYEFASLSCGHCASFHNDVLPGLKEKYIDTGKLYLVFKDFPLNLPALEATMVARCMPEKRYYSFTNLLFETQDQWAYGQNYRRKLLQSAKLAGMSEARFNQCLASDELREGLIEKVQKASEKWDISSTPTFILNKGQDSITGAQPREVFYDKIDKLLPDGQSQSSPQE